jgi:hypothetical protein
MVGSRGRFVFDLTTQAYGGGNGFEIHQKMKAFAIFINISIVRGTPRVVRRFRPRKLMAAMHGCGTISRSF